MHSLDVENPWKGYFPIPNNRNRDRLMWHVENEKTDLSKELLECISRICESIPETYLHEAYVLSCHNNYFFFNMEK